MVYERYFPLGERDSIEPSRDFTAERVCAVCGEVMTPSESFKYFIEDKQLLEREAAQMFGVNERTIRNWKKGQGRIPVAVLREIDDTSEVSTSFHYQTAKTIYRLINAVQDLELEVLSLKREMNDINTERAIGNPHRLLTVIR